MALAIMGFVILGTGELFDYGLGFNSKLLIEYDT